MLALAIRKLAPPPSKKPMPVYHFAPDLGVCDLLQARYSGAYAPADFAPEEYAWMKTPVRKVDLSRPLDYMAPNSVYGMVHSHVLEHVPGSIDKIITDMNRAIAPGGFHLFQVPIETGWYREDMDPNMATSERERVFKQFDHLRAFGQKDFEDRCLRLFDGFDQIDLRKHLDEEDLAHAAVPASSLTSNTGHTAFMFIKKTEPRSLLSRLLRR
ncbi:hypothetical protein J2Z19_002056 [Ensifer adhaerens]|uniref:Uncharacterized protein n=1 Tax=Ensifer adhaerens TaxID=106592 RepID=A0ACC5SUH7_ENSAD|nr:hypothetical protein [Ensifer adhaerens]MBP1872344.1 hypothetical protein [Ensifer adhaerens]